MSPCPSCPAGLYADTKRATACTACANGLVANNKSTACEAPPWRTAASCGDQFYLDDETSIDAMQWECRPCPPGGYCSGPVSLSDMPPLFGWWRVPQSMRAEGSAYFLECLYHAACLGMPNAALQNRYFTRREEEQERGDDASRDNATTAATADRRARRELANKDDGVTAGDVDTQDLAKMSFRRLNRTCNTRLGFKAESPLCHSCAPGTRRLGRARCATCPDSSANYLLMVGGALLIICVLIVVITTTIAAAGRQKISEGVTKVMRK